MWGGRGQAKAPWRSSSARISKTSRYRRLTSSIWTFHLGISLVTFGTMAFAFVATLFVTLIEQTDFLSISESTPTQSERKPTPHLITSDNLIAFEILDQPDPDDQTGPNFHLVIYTLNQDAKDPWTPKVKITADQLVEALRAQQPVPSLD